jgi:copper chaperone
MKTLKFKTNIKCGGCVSAVTPHLEAVEGIAGNWQVDVATPDKILTVQSDRVTAADVKAAVQNAGYRAEPV